MLTTPSLPTLSPLRDSITKAFRMDETECLNQLLPLATFAHESLAHIKIKANQLILGAREYQKKLGKIDILLHHYDLSTDEGVALMCLAEALLRIPDKTTIDKLISDKLSSAQWKNHLSTNNSLFVNATTWSLLLSGKIYAPTLPQQENLLNSLQRTISRLGVAVIRPVILKMMRTMGNHFVIGEDIEIAIKRAKKLGELGYCFSYDMLGEAAQTKQDASIYYQSYQHAIEAIGLISEAKDPIKNSGISVKLSALHPRYNFTQRERLLVEIPPLVLSLAQQAKKYQIGLVIDAEEADRQDLLLDIFEKVFTDPSLSGWEGFGLAIQAYQKRASFMIDWLQELAKQHGKRIFVRLIKGAYWDTEIKITQVQGLKDYPVFTRKTATDVSYLACANKLLANNQYFYPQFGTHNAYSVAAILEMARSHHEFEFQSLYGMGRPLYDQIVSKKNVNPPPCRIYAPVGTHKNLLGYLVRRLLENGANSSFLHHLAEEKTPVAKLLIDPATRIAALTRKPHPHIPSPRDIYGQWKNSESPDLANSHDFLTLKKQLETAQQEEWLATPIINGNINTERPALPVVSPGNTDLVIGTVCNTEESEVEQTLQIAVAAAQSWGETNITERVRILEQAAELLQAEMPRLIYLVAREGGRCILNCIAEIREAIDYCRYYAYRARHDFQTLNLPGPTGEANQLSLHPRGVFACISPWNFPVALFTGQIVAALVTGNAVIAKPAEQTPLTAFKVVQILHRAGVPKNVLQLLIGSGNIGAKLVSDPRIDGVLFTGSTETAKAIEQSLANRAGPIATFIAETGGQNAMIVDSSALPEQTVIDIAQSAFDSAGQRCSALRILFLQEDIAPQILTMLQGYMAELTIGDPCHLKTDIGPIIDRSAQQMLMQHFAKMSYEGKLIAQVPMPDLPNGHYFSPCVFELDNLNPLKQEVFGPILHVIRYRSQDLNKVMDAIINTGYGLTLGIHSRVDATVQYIAKRMPIGNVYVNRNMIGAVVGVQPFGGERLSGTGPKAGGPHYLPRLCIERTISINTTAIGGNANLVSILEDD
jgi:RHH-type proline utilization regulon transcriptional repressor/proline dehydrogenase/delta 1-pyrroline-5-carboxylate dehydrogenase